MIEIFTLISSMSGKYTKSKSKKTSTFKQGNQNTMKSGSSKMWARILVRQNVAEEDKSSESIYESYRHFSSAIMQKQLSKRL